MSIWAHFPLEPGSKAYSILDQAVKDFEHGLVSIVTDCINTPELDASFYEAHVMPPSLHSEFLHLISTICDNSRPQLAPSIKSGKLWCQLGHYLYLYHRLVKCQSLSWFIIFPIIQQHLNSRLITSHWILPKRRMIKVFLIFRLSLMQLLMPLQAQSS